MKPELIMASFMLCGWQVCMHARVHMENAYLELIIISALQHIDRSAFIVSMLILTCPPTGWTRLATTSHKTGMRLLGPGAVLCLLATLQATLSQEVRCSHCTSSTSYRGVARISKHVNDVVTDTYNNMYVQSSCLFVVYQLCLSTFPAVCGDMLYHRHWWGMELGCDCRGTGTKVPDIGMGNGPTRHSVSSAMVSRASVYRRRQCKSFWTSWPPCIV